MAISPKKKSENAMVPTDKKVDKKLASPVQTAPEVSQVTADTEIHPDDTVGVLQSDRSEEVPSLLGGDIVFGNKALEITQSEINEYEETFSQYDVDSGEEKNTAASAAALPQETTNTQLIPEIITELATIKEAQMVAGVEQNKFQETLQDTLANIQNISLKIDGVSHDTETLIKQIDSASTNLAVLSGEMDVFNSASHSKSTLSKSFLLCSSLILVLLVSFQIYMFASLNKIQLLQNTAGSTVLQNISNLNKKMADYDKNITKALDIPVQQEHPQPNQVSTPKNGHAAAENIQASTVTITPVMERLNKLRNGLPEKKLFRNETGDWFTYNKKSNHESISDVEVIKSLNEAYRKIGRTITPGIPLPPIKALCLLKPDGKGGTQIVMTKEFVQ
ncbi:MAG: hypothetical protein PHF56_02445 [Desulfuromonadaceae bacterium]|nr:hypothetical protein [Desulfuromonadaceae bacterium]